MTPLDKPLRRELLLNDVAYTLVIDPVGLKLTEKGRRRGIELRWTELASTSESEPSASPRTAVEAERD